MYPTLTAVLHLVRSTDINTSHVRCIDHCSGICIAVELRLETRLEMAIEYASMNFAFCQGDRKSVV